MTSTKRLFELFILSNTKARDGITKNAAFYRTYGDVSFEEAFEVYLPSINEYLAIKEKIARFEKFLISNGIEREQSGRSESRYYIYKGIKYRFSSHIYPTGSMTNEMLGIVDFAADPELINEIKF